eukprot:2653763-Rhodomonas_salina.2
MAWVRIPPSLLARGIGVEVTCWFPTPGPRVRVPDSPFEAHSSVAEQSRASVYATGPHFDPGPGAPSLFGCSLAPSAGLTSTTTTSRSPPI